MQPGSDSSADFSGGKHRETSQYPGRQHPPRAASQKPERKKTKRKEKKPRSLAGAPMRGPEHRERAVMGMTAGSYLVPRARPDRNPTAVDIRRDGCCWMMMSEEDGERERERERRKND